MWIRKIPIACAINYCIELIPLSIHRVLTVHDPFKERTMHEQKNKNRANAGTSFKNWPALTPILY